MKIFNPSPHNHIKKKHAKSNLRVFKIKYPDGSGEWCFMHDGILYNGHKFKKRAIEMCKIMMAEAQGSRDNISPPSLLYVCENEAQDVPYNAVNY